MYGVMYDVAGSIESYDQVSDEIARELGGATPAGLLTHVGMPTADGFRIVEVWASKEDSDRFGEQTVTPVIRRVLPDVDTEPVVTEFEVRRLLVGGATLPSARSASSSESAGSGESAAAAEYIG